MKDLESVNDKSKWLSWAIELQFIAQAGITYTKDSFDEERFERIREIAAEMISSKTDWELEKVKSVFCNETGFQTPKLDTRAAVFKENKILLVKEQNETWSLPGGWVDVHESVASNTVKEVKEESGYTVRPIKLIAVQDRKKHNKPDYAYGICKMFLHCEILSYEEKFKPNIETVDRDFFSLNNLPTLATEKNTKEQIEMCFKSYHSNDWKTIFD